LMAMHTRAVARGAAGKFIVADMPFLSMRKGAAHALDCAAQLMRAGANAVKVEGVRGHGYVVQHLVESGIPVMGHLGLLPQSVHAVGGYRVQGKDAATAARLRRDVAAFERAGAFAVVLECIPQKLAAQITRAAAMATIGIGAGAECDGQVLVLHDLLGFDPVFAPRFVRRFADGAGLVQQGVKKYGAAVRAKKFPAAKESF
jgi:3-methyl-2-oxobutanoate hydroxymethyltransferase